MLHYVRRIIWWKKCRAFHKFQKMICILWWSHWSGFEFALKMKTCVSGAYFCDPTCAQVVCSPALAWTWDRHSPKSHSPVLLLSSPENSPRDRTDRDSLPENQKIPLTRTTNVLLLIDFSQEGVTHLFLFSWSDNKETVRAINPRAKHFPNASKSQVKSKWADTNTNTSIPSRWCRCHRSQCCLWRGPLCCRYCCSSCCCEAAAYSNTQTHLKLTLRSHFNPVHV